MHITAIKGTTFQLHISGVFTDDTGTDVLTKNLPEGGLSIFGYDTSILSIGSPVPDEFGFMVPVTVVADSGKTEITASVGPITGTMTFSVKEVVPPVIVATKLILTATGDVEVI